MEGLRDKNRCFYHLALTIFAASFSPKRLFLFLIFCKIFCRAFISRDQCEGLSTMGLRVREWEEARLSSLLSRLPSPGELLVMRLLALWRLGVMGRLRLCLNIVTNVTCH